MNRSIFFIIMAGLGFGAGASLQKYGLSSTVPKLGLRTLVRQWRGILGGVMSSRAWLLGIFVNVTGTLFYFQALSEGELTVIQPLVSLNIAVAVVIGVLVLKESMGRGEWLGVLVMILGTVLLAAGAARDVEAVALDPLAVIVMTAAVTGCSLLLALVGTRLSMEFRLAAIAGLMFGLGTVCFKLAASEVGRALGSFSVMRAGDWLEMITFVTWWVFVAVNSIGFLSYQGAFSHGRVSMVVTVTTLFGFLTPVIVGFALFGEAVSGMKVGGILCTIAGVLLLGGGKTEGEGA
ncbi:EamA family transporter [Thermodesulfobacteriota bacterium]